MSSKSYEIHINSKYDDYNIGSDTDSECFSSDSNSDSDTAYDEVNYSCNELLMVMVCLLIFIAIVVVLITYL